MKNVIITGASGFLGTATVKYFLEKGYSVTAFIHDANDRHKLSGYPALKYVAVDLADAGKVSDLVQQAIQESGQIHACLLIAGGYTGGDIAGTGVDVIRQQISLNFETAYNVIKSVYPHFKEKNEGRIVMIGSEPALVPKKGGKSLAYALSKSFVFQLAAILNEEAKGTNLVTNVVVPSTIDTDANRKSMPNADFSKWVKPEQLAETMEILCSEAASAWREPVIKVYNNAG